MRLIPALAALLILSASAQAAELPKRKAGLWQITMAFANTQHPPMVSKLCVDASTDAKLAEQNLLGKAMTCSKRDITRSGNVTTIDSVCTMSGHTMTGHAVITELSDAAYHVEQKSHTEPPMMSGRGDHSMTQDGKWLGSCPASMKPGDMEMAGGMKMNVLDNAGPGAHP